MSGEEDAAVARNELVMTGGGSALPSVSEKLSKELWKLLTKDGDSRRTIETALDGPHAATLIAEARAGLPMLAASATPGGMDAVGLAMGRLVLIYGDGARDKRQWAAYVREIAEAVGWMPFEAIMAGARDFRDDPTSKTIPLPGELVGKCKPHEERIRIAVYRARLLAQATERPAAAVVDPAERERQIALTRDFLKGSGSKSAAAFAPPDKSKLRTDVEPLPPSTAGAGFKAQGVPAYGSALTPAMLRSLGREVPIAPDPSPDPPPHEEDPGAMTEEERLAELFPF